MGPDPSSNSPPRVSQKQGPPTNGQRPPPGLQSDELKMLWLAPGPKL